MQELCLLWCFNKVIVLQATIGIDFLSKTMYLEDRTVNPVCFCHSHHFHKQLEIFSSLHVHIIPPFISLLHSTLKKKKSHYSVFYH